jgi:hypothetical protein
MQKLQELEDLHSRMESQEDAVSLQLSLCSSTFGSTVVALLQLSSDLMAFFASKGYETPQHITDILNRMAVGSTCMEVPTMMSTAEMASPTPADGLTNARVRDWVSAASSQSPSAGAFSLLRALHQFSSFLTRYYWYVVICKHRIIVVMYRCLEHIA